MYSTFVLLFVAVVALASAHTADECPKLCNEVKFDVLTLAMCRYVIVLYIYIYI